MANPDLTAGQVDTLAAAIKGLQEALDAMNKSAQRAGGSLSRQGEISANVTSSITDNANALDRLEDALNGMSGAQRRAATETQNSKDQLSSLEAQINSLTTAEERNAAAKQSMVKGLTRVFAGLKLFGGFIGSAISGILSLANAIFMLPFRLLGGLVEFASEGGGGNELREAYEDVRKVFGDLASGSAKDLISSFTGMRKEAGNLASSGMRLGKIFGVGPGGLAAALRFIQETAEGLGAQFELLRQTFVESGAELIIFRKGLGLSAEQMGAFSTLTIASGGDLIETLGEVANLSLQLADRFNLDAKKISQDMATLSKDFINFGHLSQQELATTAVFARKSGLSIEGLMNMVKQFSTFESAAESAAMLNQALGIQIDAMEMLTADPAEQLKKIQDAFFATGRSVDDLNRAEKQLLATQLNLSGEELAAALSPENMGRSLEEIQAAAAGAADAPLSTEEAMTRLAASIEKVFATGGGMRSFFDAFSQGFEQGLRYFGPTRALFRSIRQSLRETKIAGREFAKMFIDNFPGIKDVVVALTAAFDPTKFRKFFTDVNAAFQKFFTTMDPNNPSSSFSSFIESLKTAFTTNFGGEGGNSVIEGLRDGFNKIATFLVSAFAGLIPSVISGVASLLNAITGLLSSKTTTFGIESGDIISEELATALNTAFSSLMDNIGDLEKPLVNLLKILFKKAEPLIEPVLTSLAGYMFATIFGPTVLNFILTSILWPAVQWIGRALIGFLGTTLGAVLFGALAAFNIGGEINRMMGDGGIGGKLTAEFGELESKIGVLAASIIDTLTLGLLPDGFIGSVARWFAGIADTIVGWFETLGLNRTLSALNEYYGSLMSVFSGFFDFIMGIVTLDGSRILDGIWSFVTGINGMLTSTFEILWAAFLDIGNMLFDGIINALGLTGPIETIKGIISDIGTTIIDAFKGVFGIRSPSTIFAGIGENLIQGLVGGVTSMATAPVNAIMNLGRSALSGFTSLVSGPAGDAFMSGASTLLTGPLNFLQGQISSIASGALDLLNSVAQSIDSISISESGLRKIESLVSILSFVTTAIQSFTRQNGAGLGEIDNTNTASALTNYSESIMETMSVIRNSLVPNMESILNDLSVFNQDQVHTTIDTFSGIVEAYNDFYDSISDLGEIDINAAIQRLGSSLGIRNQEVTVKNEPINVTINLNVTMDADEIAATLTHNTRRRPLMAVPSP